MLTKTKGNRIGNEKRKNFGNMLEEIYPMQMIAVEQKIIAEDEQEDTDEWVASINSQTDSYEEILEKLKEII